MAKVGLYLQPSRMPADTQAGRPRIDLSRYELKVDGQRVKLERQPMELLMFFVARRGHLVTLWDQGEQAVSAHHKSLWGFPMILLYV